MEGVLAWPFWTKLVVVGIGFTGGLVFMYVQCKVYIHLCRKWKAYNRIIVVQDAPEGAAELKKARVAAAAAAEKAAKAAETAENQRRPSTEPGRGAANPSSSLSEETNRSSSATAPGRYIQALTCFFKASYKVLWQSKLTHFEGLPCEKLAQSVMRNLQNATYHLLCASYWLC